MRVTADDVEDAIAEALRRNASPTFFGAIDGAMFAIEGELDLGHVADALSERLGDNLVGRAPLAGKHARPPAAQPERGRCRVCGCDDDHACVDLVPILKGSDQCRNCSWADHTHTLCDNPACLAAVAAPELERASAP